MTETVFYKLTRHDDDDFDEGVKYPAPILAERPSISELVALALLDIGGGLGKRQRVDRGRMAALFETMPTPEDLPFVVHIESTRWVIEPADEADRSINVRLPIEVSRGSLADARNSLAFFQLDQAEKVTAEVDDDHLRVYLDEHVLSWYLDTDAPETYIRERGAAGDRSVDEVYADNEMMAETINSAMAALAGFLYSAQIGAINALSGEARS